MPLNAEALRGYLDYLHDLGIYDLYRHGEPGSKPESAARFESFIQSLKPEPQHTLPVRTPAPNRATVPNSPKPPAIPLRSPAGLDIVITPSPAAPKPPPVQSFIAPDDDLSPETRPFAPPPMPLISFNQLAPLPTIRNASAEKPAALKALRDIIGDCTRCPLAYAGRHTIVFGDGDPAAQLMFVGEGPGADEDASGLPFVGKAGQLLNNMIGAMGLQREQVFIANIVKCRPPGNRAPEFIEATTCSQFLLRQIDIVQPKVIVALGATAATYVLGVRQTLSSLRGQWFQARGAKVVVTFHPAFLLRDPRQKGEAWKDLQRVMAELALTPPVPRKS